MCVNLRSLSWGGVWVFSTNLNQLCVHLLQHAPSIREVRIVSGLGSGCRPPRLTRFA